MKKRISHEFQEAQIDRGGIMAYGFGCTSTSISPQTSYVEETTKNDKSRINKGLY